VATPPLRARDLNPGHGSGATVHVAPLPLHLPRNRSSDHEKQTCEQRFFGVPLGGGHFESAQAYREWLGAMGTIFKCVWRDEVREQDEIGEVIYVFWDGPQERKFLTRLYPIGEPHLELTSMLATARAQ